MVLTRQRRRLRTRSTDRSGSAATTRPPDGSPGPVCDWSFTVDAVTGQDPLGDRAGFRPDSDAELRPSSPTAPPTPTRSPSEQGPALRPPARPDLCVVHTASHHWAEQGVPHRRARLSGCGAEPGAVPDQRSRCPLRRAGCRPGRADGRHRTHRPRAARRRPVDPGRRRRPADRPRARPRRARQGDGPRHVVGTMLDGCNPNVLYDSVARGEAPHIGPARGRRGPSDGIVSSLPTVTLPNRHGDHRSAPRPPRDPATPGGTATGASR